MTNHLYYSGAPLRLGPGPQLLFDDVLVEDRWRLRREIFRPEKHFRNPIVSNDHPWEGDLIHSPSVIWDESYGRFRMWYNAFVFSDYIHYDIRRKYVLYAESDDGIRWEKPCLDLVAYGPHTKTNIVYRGTFAEDPSHYGVECNQVWRDESEPDSTKRYKMFCYESRPDENGFRRGVNLAGSPDGFRWKLIQDRHILDYNSDTTNHAVFDAEAGHWLLYVRPRCTHATGLTPHEPSPGGFHPGGRHHSRRVAVMVSEDLRLWSYPRTCLYPDEHDTPDYDSTAVFRAGSHFIMLYTAFDDDTDGCKDVRFASSADGFHWTRVHSREPFIARGRPGDWDASQIMRISTAPPILHGNRMMIYYGGADVGQHDHHGSGGMGLVTTMRDRFVMQWAGDETAWLITREFILEGNRLRVNLYYPKTKNVVHYLKAELLRHPPLGSHGPLGKPGGFHAPFEGCSLADCDVVVENGTEALVTWRGNADLSPLMGKPVYVRFELRNMGLFAFSTPRE